MTKLNKVITQYFNNSFDFIQTKMYKRMLENIYQSDQIDHTVVFNKRKTTWRHGKKIIPVLIGCSLIITLGYYQHWGITNQGKSLQHVIKSSREILYFNEISALNQTYNLSLPLPLEITQNDIIQEFGLDPLKNLWIPSDYKSCFGLKMANGEYGAYGYPVYGIETRHYYWTTVYYATSPENQSTNIIKISLSHNTIPHSDNSALRGKLSKIKGTDVTIFDVNNHIDSNYFYATFVYRDIGYIVYAYRGITKSEFIHILNSLI